MVAYMVADTEEDMLADMEVDMVADMVADIDIEIDMEMQFGERVGLPGASSKLYSCFHLIWHSLSFRCHAFLVLYSKSYYIPFAMSVVLLIFFSDRGMDQ